MKNNIYEMFKARNIRKNNKKDLTFNERYDRIKIDRTV